MMKSLLFLLSLLVVVAADVQQDRDAMLALAKAFHPHPPRWSTLSSFAYCKWQGVKCNFNNHQVISLNLSGLALGGVISPAIGLLANLEEVYLQRNNLEGEISSSLTTLPFLRILDVSNNNLSGAVPKFENSVNFVYNPGNSLLKHKSRRGLSVFMMFGIVVGAALVILAIIGLLVWMYKCKESTTMNTKDISNALIGHDVIGETGSEGDHPYTVEILRQATNGFSNENVLGKGGSSVVYRGEHPHGIMIAVKRISSKSIDERGINEFKTEINVLTGLRHKNLVPLLGYCENSDEKLLVYEYMPNGTLAQHLFKWKKLGHVPLTWKQRLIIAMDVGRGIEYLHGLGRGSFIHRDLKPSNILLGDGMRAKVSDFGLIKIVPDEKDSMTTNWMGTFGYIAPEYANTGRVTKKVDVYAFGVILLEMITGKKAVDETLGEEGSNLAMWLRPKLRNGKFWEDLDETVVIDNEEAMRSIEKVAKISENCISIELKRRPTMGQVMTVLVPLVEDLTPSSPQKDDSMEKDSVSLLESVRRWQLEDEEGTSMGFHLGEPSYSKDERAQSHPSTSGHQEIQMASFSESE